MADPNRLMRPRVAKQDPTPTKEQAAPESARHENAPGAPMPSGKVTFNQYYVNVRTSREHGLLKKLGKGAAEAEERTEAFQTKTDERIKELEIWTELNKRSLANLHTLLTTTQANRSKPGGQELHVTSLGAGIKKLVACHEALVLRLTYGRPVTFPQLIFGTTA
ncbi:hypothetical protein LTR27_003647 [Elasticomyces elasticus]|nr:hypothetical protein LTR27_003647 [Elasticomyces elasticus]